MRTLRQSLINANALLVFESAARLGSFTRAAEELGVSQPAVTRQVRAVEALVGRPLFRRAHNRLSLTAEGRRLAAAAASGFGEIAATLDALRDEGHRPRLVLAAHAGFAQQWLIPRVADLRAALPDHELRLVVADAGLDPEAAESDLAVRVGNGRWPGQVSHALTPEIVFPVASPRLLEERPELRAPAPADLLSAPLLHMDEGARPWMTWRGWLRAQGVTTPPPPPGVLYNNYPLVLQEALAGGGVALGWRPLVDDMVARGNLVAVGPQAVNPQLGYHLTRPEHGGAGPAADAVLTWFRANLAGIDGA